jgi:hypothetical protein
MMPRSSSHSRSDSLPRNAGSMPHRMAPPKGAAPRPSERVTGDLAWLGHGSERSRFGDLQSSAAPRHALQSRRPQTPRVRPIARCGWPSPGACFPLRAAAARSARQHRNGGRGMAVTPHEPVLHPHLARPACGVRVTLGWLPWRARGPPPPAAQPPVLPLGRRRVTAANHWARSEAALASRAGVADLGCRVTCLARFGSSHLSRRPARSRVLGCCGPCSAAGSTG